MRPVPMHTLVMLDGVGDKPPDPVLRLADVESSASRRAFSYPLIPFFERHRRDAGGEAVPNRPCTAKTRF